MQKTAWYRGSFPMPWLSESFFLANADTLMARTDTGSDSAGKLSHFGSGGNVTQSYGNIISFAGKFGIRAEHIPALIGLADVVEYRMGRCRQCEFTGTLRSVCAENIIK